MIVMGPETAPAGHAPPAGATPTQPADEYVPVDTAAQREAYLAALAERYRTPVREYHGTPEPRRREPPPPVSELDAARHRRQLLDGIAETRWFEDVRGEAQF